jgi:predicted kinase
MKLAEINKSDIILLCGLYGAGKSEFSELYLKNSGRIRISRTEIRKRLYSMINFGKEWVETDFNEDDEVLFKHVERKIFEHYLHKKKKILLVNTFMTVKSRQKFIEIARMNKKTISAIFLDTPMKDCIERNNEKVTGVNESVIMKLNTMKQLPDTSEGFTYVAAMKNFKEPEKPKSDTGEGLVEVPSDDL